MYAPDSRLSPLLFAPLRAPVLGFIKADLKVAGMNKLRGWRLVILKWDIIPLK